jgi:hypothetical protein
MHMFNAKILRATAFLALALSPVMACRADDERQSLEELRNTVVNLLQALVDQGVISKEKAQQMVKAAQQKAGTDAAAVAKGDEGAVRVPYVPQIIKDEIAKQVAEQVKPAVVADVVKEAKTEKWGVPGALADWLTRTRLSGEITLREEGILYSGKNASEYNYFAMFSRARQIGRGIGPQRLHHRGHARGDRQHVGPRVRNSDFGRHGAVRVRARSTVHPLG